MWQFSVLHAVCAAQQNGHLVMQMDGVPGQLPGKRIDDYLSMLSEDSTLSNNQSDGSAKVKNNMQLEEISLI